MLLILDNYDSFTYNLVQYFGELGVEMQIHRNDALTVDQVKALAPEKICISPGPCTPNEAGISLELIRQLGPTTPILGVCLGHQSIGQVYGGDVVRADRLMHGKTSPIHHNGSSVFAGLPNPFEATRYHSLIVKRDTLPDCLEITAWTAEDEIMGLRHKEHPVHGVQFHPESILTEHGKQMLETFLRL
ncbi:MAG: aminodeoxychorismate/anthranilate synthase component II [Akkermansiaceae bacterium]|nr:aminodeoxychorismate/anthranilate synthase component II [Akkermansiaceae bacterium]MDP4646479.1 aminodeoxychorismate/anthranilate synthase component II [Akkermansiaceae bacterium]MDP4780087.1 aminodeoxychorismate/anthranilate synthase component II [Akkermansiaceae bacterium]MDP4847680.1 aminodeoxychorismate/anthranilate synthase component II [Akkermansiaceae bacterium]MDP4896373.1 aminodeoxychorismate/anthranilate synthase component II [Akkermansiaceae bacterium]